jgi:hypothetical protein
MTLIAVVYGDWRPSFGGTRAHYGHGPVALCGSRRNFTDSRIPRDKCARCLKLKQLKKGQVIS